MLFCVAAATDWIDGRLARRWQVTTKLGSFLDTTADKLLVSGVLIALLAAERASPWIVGLIIGRELVLMGVRGAIASEGEVMAPSMLGKLKTGIQFLAIALAIVRPGDPVGGLFVDEWAMLAAAAITVWSAADYLVRAWPALTQGRRRHVTRVFLTGGSGLIGGALADRLVERGDELVALARSDAAERALAARGARVVRGDVLDEDALAAGMAGCELVYHVAGVNSLCPADPARLFHVNVRGAETAVRAAARAGVARVVLTSSAASLGEPHGSVGDEATPHRGTYLSVYERSKHEGELAAFAAARRAGVELVVDQPVVGPGTGPLGRHRPDPDRLPQRPPEGVPRHEHQHRRHRRLRRGPRARRRAGRGRASATCSTAPRSPPPRRSRSSPSCRASGIACGCCPRRSRAPPRRWSRAPTASGGKQPPVCREMVRTLLHGHRYDGTRAARELGLRYTPVRRDVPAHDRLGRARGPGQAGPSFSAARRVDRGTGQHETEEQHGTP